MDHVSHIEDELVQRLALALTRPGATAPRVDVASWPGRPDDYRMDHPVGAVLVIYKGADYADASTDAGPVAKLAEFELGVIARNLRAPNGPGIDRAQGLGAYELLAVCRQALMGWQPQRASQAVQMRAESFTGQAQGKWSYSMHVAVPVRLLPSIDSETGLPQLADLDFDVLGGTHDVYPPAQTPSF